MSTSLSAIAGRGQQFFDQLPDEMIKLVFEFLKGKNGSISPFPKDDRTIIATASVCKNWQENPTLKKERQEAATRLHQRTALQNVHDQIVEREYPPKMVELLRSHNLNIRQLPILDVKRSLFPGFQIDCGSCDKKNLTHPIMRFRTEDNRPGIVITYSGFR